MERVNLHLLLKLIWGKIFSFIHTPWYHYKKLGSHVWIDKRVIDISGAEFLSIGDNTKIYANARIVSIKKYRNKFFHPEIIIDSNVVIGQNFHCTCAEKIYIGQGTSITPNCGIFDIIHPYENVKENPRNQPIKTSPIIIGKNCMIGMNSVIQAGVILGDHVVVGSNCTVIKGIYPSYSVLAGSPAKLVKLYNEKKQKWEKV